jgi:hypothetical protein
MPNWRKVILSGSTASLNSLTVSNGITGSLFGTASWARNSITSSYSLTSSFVNTLNQNVLINGSLNVTASFTASGLNYPSADNGEEAFIQTDGNGSLSLQYVRTLYEEIYNGESTQLIKGTPVYVSGSVGAAAKVYRADASNPAKVPAIYITADTLAPTEVGRGITIGLIKGVDTTGFPAGTTIYLAPGSGSGWTSTRPTGSATIQLLGFVTKEGTGGQGNVLNPGPAILPNIQTGYTWVGDGNSYPTPISTSSLSVASSSYATSATTASLVNGNVTVITATIGNTLYATAGTTIGAGTTPIYSVSNASYSSIFVDYSINESTTNARAGTIQVISVGSEINYTETTTMDIGNTSDITWDIYLSGIDINFDIVNAAGASWIIKFNARQM